MTTTLAGLARFTPSLLGADTLESLFVNREHLLVDAVERIERASRSSERASRLFIGSRGAGKTHLVSLIYHRAKALPGFGETFRLAWLPEDMWTLGDLDDLCEQIIERVEPAVSPADGPPLSRLVDAAASAPVVVLVENLDLVLEALGSEGQALLRGMMETTRSLLLIATSTRLTDDFYDQAVPFYGFFDTTTLQPFDVDEAAAMLKELARLRGDETLVRELDSPRARGRLAAVAHLAGGQPRIWALFGSGLTVDGLDDLVSVLLQRFDDLTPYYQEQLRRLSVQERKVVHALVSSDHSMTVKEMAAAAKVDERSLGRTVTDLKRKGWIKPRTGLLAEMTDRRLTFYDLAEPLARLAFQLKESRGEPVRLVIDFLKVWFDQDALAVAPSAESIAGYLASALTRGSVDELVQLCTEIGGGSDRFPTRWAYSAGGIDDGLLELESALAALDDGEPIALLHQPAVISELMETLLGDHSAAWLRLALARTAVDGHAPADWTARVDQLIEQTRGDDQVAAMLLGGVLRVLREDFVQGQALLRSVAFDPDVGEESEQLLWIEWAAARLSDCGQPGLAAELLDPRHVGSAKARLRLSGRRVLAQARSGAVMDDTAIWRERISSLRRQTPDHDVVMLVLALTETTIALVASGRRGEAVHFAQEAAKAFAEGRSRGLPGCGPTFDGARLLVLAAVEAAEPDADRRTELAQMAGLTLEPGAADATPETLIGL